MTEESSKFTNPFRALISQPVQWIPKPLPVSSLTNEYFSPEIRNWIRAENSEQLFRSLSFYYFKLFSNSSFFSTSNNKSDMPTTDQHYISRQTGSFSILSRLFSVEIWNSTQIIINPMNDSFFFFQNPIKIFSTFTGA